MRRWSDNDHVWGPFLWAYSKTYRPISIVLESLDDEEWSEGHAVSKLRLCAFGCALQIVLPPILKPKLIKVMARTWDAETVKRLGRDWYMQAEQRVFGFSYLPGEGFLQVFRGARTMDSLTDRTWSKHLPWTQWRHVRHSLYTLEEGHFWTDPDSLLGLGYRWDALQRAREAVPKVRYLVRDGYDGEMIVAECFIEEREWRFGTGWFKWLSWFRRPMIKRSLDISYSKEVGPRKGSWKGGMTGHSCEMLQGDTPMQAFLRYCPLENLQFIGFAHAADTAQSVAVPPDVAEILKGAESGQALDDLGSQNAEGEVRKS
jgi:hypothetical protein